MDVCIFNKIIKILMILIMMAIIVIIKANVYHVFSCALIVNLPFVYVEYYYFRFTDEETEVWES